MQYDNYLIVSDYEGHCINVFDRDGILFTNLESRGKERGSSMDLVACLLTRQDICWSVTH